MFAQHTSFSTPVNPGMLSSLYRQVGVQTGVAAASPHQLVLMLYDGVLESIARAHGAIQADDVDAKGRAIGRATRIVDEGLKAALSPAGGELTGNLAALYTYVSKRLLQAQLHNDTDALDECRRLVEPLRDAWAAIGARVPA